MSPIIRPARAEELQRAEDLVVGSINDLTARHGFGPMASQRPATFQTFSLRDDPGGLWVAEADGDIVGFAFSWACGDLWFLAELFIAPSQQGHGIGNALLARTFEHARTSGATTRALITFAFNIVSQGLYIRHGLYPRVPLHLVSGARDAVRHGLQGTSLRHSRIEHGALHLKMLAAIDASALGVAREKHHMFLLGDAAMKGFFLHDGDDCVGYVYLSSSGHIGPLAVVRPEQMGAAFRTALTLVADGAEAVSALLPGFCGPALDVAAACNMRITFPMMLMSSRDFGDWRSYLPRNPGFM